MKAKCKKCGDTVEVTRLKEYKTCKCGAIGLDFGNGFYYRVCGNIEDFDGEIEGVPSIGSTAYYDIMTDDTKVHLVSRQKGKMMEATTTFNEPIIEAPARSRIILDNFWAEMAEHFKAMAELCEKKAKK